MAFLSLVQNSRGHLFLHSTVPSKNDNFSIFHISGEGPCVVFGNNTWARVEGIEAVEYDESNADKFWHARRLVIQSAIVMPSVYPKLFLRVEGL